MNNSTDTKLRIELAYLEGYEEGVSKLESFAKWLDEQRDQKKLIWKDTNVWGEFGAFGRLLEIFKEETKKK